MVEVFINEKKINVTKGLTILQTCEEIGIQIPRFCYHEQLSIAGNCRMCLVEIDKSIKPVASCALTVENGMKIYTNTTLVKKAREGVMEFLLINHPLDCPICDQGGECDLQDQALLFGNDRGRFYESKRSVSELDLGPFVKTVMTRCIHCTRCVRFLTELGGIFLLGTTGRGNKTEIGTYSKKNIYSEVMGNVIDLCPVGALTSKPYAFTTRSWELTKIESIDTFDSMGSNIAYHIYNGKVMRVLPILHNGINEEWITDKIRFAYDGFVVQRLVIPLYREEDLLKQNKLKNIIKFFSINLNKKIFISLNDDFSLEMAYSIKKIKNVVKSTQISLKNSMYKGNIDFRQMYLFNTGYSQISLSDLCVIIGINLKKEMPLLLIRLRKEVKNKQLKLVVFSNMESYGLNEISLGLNFSNVVALCEGKHVICSLLKKANFPIIFCGNGVLNRDFGVNLFGLFNSIPNLIQKNWNGLNFIYNGIGDITAKEVGLQTEFVKSKANVKFFNFNNNYFLPKVKDNLFFGTHGDSIVSRYNTIFPIKLNIEDNAIFINNEGRVQTTKVVQLTAKTVKREWEYIGIFFDFLFSTKNFSDLNTKLKKEIYDVLHLSLNVVSYVTFLKTKKNKFILRQYPILPYVTNSFIGNSTCKNSRNVEKVKQYIKKNNYN